MDRIIQLIKVNNKITKANIAKKLGVSEKTIEREMKKADKVIYDVCIIQGLLFL